MIFLNYYVGKPWFINNVTSQRSISAKTYKEAHDSEVYSFFLPCNYYVI